MGSLRIVQAAGVAVDQNLAPDNDVVWHHDYVDDLPVCAEHWFGPVTQPCGTDAIELRFAFDGKTACRFVVSPDGRGVRSTSVGWLSDQDLNRLFYDVVMRAVYSAMDLPSFHASALVKDGKALMIMGDKGRGKSTLSGALRLIGWEVLADDLVGVVEHEGRWSAIHGQGESKLNDDSARALGLNLESLGRQWFHATPTDPQKHIFLQSADATADDTPVPVVHLIFLDRRGADVDSVRVEDCRTAEGIMHLLQNVTADFSGTRQRPSSNMRNAAGGLASQARMLRLSMPDDLARLRDAAREVDDRLMRGNG